MTYPGLEDIVRNEGVGDWNIERVADHLDLSVDMVRDRLESSVEAPGNGIYRVNGVYKMAEERAP